MTSYSKGRPPASHSAPLGSLQRVCVICRRVFRIEKGAPLSRTCRFCRPSLAA